MVWGVTASQHWLLEFHIRTMTIQLWIVTRGGQHVLQWWNKTTACSTEWREFESCQIPDPVLNIVMHYSNVNERVQFQFSQIVEDFLRQREGRMSALHPLLFEISSEVAQFGSIWVNLGQFGSIWVNLGQFGSIVRLDPKTFSFLKGTILKDPRNFGLFLKKGIFFVWCWYCSFFYSCSLG